MATPLGIGYDLTFELNEFQQPRIRSELELIKNTLLFVLFAKPGDYPSLPHIGLNINKLLYNFYDEIDVNQLRQDIIKQCDALNTFINNDTIMIKKLKYNKEPSLIIQINGVEQFPNGYLKDNYNPTNKYMIGITFDNDKQMIYNVHSE